MQNHLGFRLEGWTMVVHSACSWLYFLCLWMFYYMLMALMHTVFQVPTQVHHDVQCMAALMLLTIPVNALFSSNTWLVL